MYGNGDCFEGMTCRNCHKLEDLDRQYKEQRQRIDELEKVMTKLTEKTTEEIKGKTETWSEKVSKKVDEELKAVNDKVKIVEERIELHAEEEKLKERKRNNIIIHRMEESKATETKEKNNEDRQEVIFLINEVLRVPCEDKTDIRSVYRLGKESDKDRPLLVEFKEGTLKNKVMENLSKLRNAEQKHKRISVTHDMTKTEREQCRELVKQSKEKQKADESGEWLYKVKGLPGDMRIVKLKKYQE